MKDSVAYRVASIIALWGTVIGCVLLAINIPISGWAYVPFLMSSICNIWLTRISNSPATLFHQAVFVTGVNIVGIFRWIIL